MHFPRYSFFVVTTCAILGLAGFAQSAGAATFVVDRTDDTADASAQACTSAPNDCSLRGAIMKSALNGGGLDTITLPAGTYTLTIAGTDEDENFTGDLDVVGSVTINGAGSRTTIINGGALDRVIHIWPITSAPGFPLTVTINDLTVTGGLGGNGAGILVQAGTIALNRLVLRDNQGISGGGLSVISTFSPVVTINRSTLTGNEATGLGGAVFLSSEFSSMTISNSTFSGNGSGDRGGAFYVASLNDLTLSNDTVTANTAGTAGGGVANDGDAILRNTLLVANSSTTGNGPDCDGFLLSDGNNLISNTAGCTGVTDGTKHDHVGDDPKLDPAGLKNNGGPTRTIALLAGSPAVDAGDDASCKPTDQRGLSRPQGAHCDIGAYEKGVCGDGFLEPEEQCDDHNTIDGDGCSATCVDEVPGAVCGNGSIETDEECDDGNVVDGDGCSSVCQSESSEGTTGGTTTGTSGGSGGCSLVR